MTSGETPGAAGQRLDRWLWFARVVKSRTLAATLVAEGKVRLNRERVSKPSQSVKAGDVVTATAHRKVHVLRILGLGVRRGPPAEARALYEDLTPPPPPRESPFAASHPVREAGSGRPTKRERRQLDRLKDGEA